MPRKAVSKKMRDFWKQKSSDPTKPKVEEKTEKPIVRHPATTIRSERHKRIILYLDKALNFEDFIFENETVSQEFVDAHIRENSRPETIAIAAEIEERIIAAGGANEIILLHPCNAAYSNFRYKPDVYIKMLLELGKKLIKDKRHLNECSEIKRVIKDVLTYIGALDKDADVVRPTVFDTNVVDFFERTALRLPNFLTHNYNSVLNKIEPGVFKVILKGSFRGDTNESLKEETRRIHESEKKKGKETEEFVFSIVLNPEIVNVLLGLKVLSTDYSAISAHHLGNAENAKNLLYEKVAGKLTDIDMAALKTRNPKLKGTKKYFAELLENTEELSKHLGEGEIKGLYEIIEDLASRFKTGNNIGLIDGFVVFKYSEKTVCVPIEVKSSLINEKKGQQEKRTVMTSFWLNMLFNKEFRSNVLAENTPVKVYHTVNVARNKNTIFIESDNRLRRIELPNGSNGN